MIKVDALEELKKLMDAGYLVQECILRPTSYSVTSDKVEVDYGPSCELVLKCVRSDGESVEESK